jgi:superfamily I DNA and/or RNA helicase
MNLKDFRTNDDYTLRDLRCKLLIKKKILSDTGRIRLVESNHYELITEQGCYDFSVEDKQDSAVVADKLKQYPYNLVSVSSIGNEKDEFFLHVAFFYNARRQIKLSIVLSEKIKKTLEDKRLLNPKNKLADAVRDNFILSDGTNSCYAYTKGKYRFSQDGEIECPEKPVADVEEMLDRFYVQKDEKGETRQFQTIKLYGKDYSFIVQIKSGSKDVFLSAESIDVKNQFSPPMAIIIGDLEFTDAETYVSEKIKKELENTSGYLDIWDRYTNIEGDILLQKARMIGEITINEKKINYGQGGLIVYFKDMNPERLKLINEGDYLLFSEQVPEYVASEGMTWQEYKELINEKKAMNIPKQKTSTRKITHIDKAGYMVIEGLENESIPNGIITYSIFGDLQRIIRRETARELIETGRSAMPHLGLVIEGSLSEEVITANHLRRIEPISPFIKEKIFEYEPRTRQRDAIDVALNTPDIAIIQGPPGTGKTTVITAIIERLNEIADKRNDNRGQVLITSFQHDAVRNVIERLSVNSLPTLKYGKQGDEDYSQEEIIEKWCRDYAERLRKRNPSIQQTEEQKEFEKIHDIYLSSPNNTNALTFLNFARSISNDNEICKEIDQIVRNINIDESSSASKLLQKIRRIRTTKEGFLDDGPETADDLLADLEEIMKAGNADNNEILSVLEDAADSYGDSVDQVLLDRLMSVKERLLKRCIPRPSYKIERPRTDILEVYEKIANSKRHIENEEDEILFNLLNELESNTSEVEQIVASYNFAYAATTQQSEGKAIRQAKSVGYMDHPTYDTVIIDEAARVNPGDLMIPMVQARRRIILVGDHRQLPHIYDEEIFENMRDSGNEVGKDVVKVSMFQYLKRMAEKLSREDGIVRTITLDAQFRMHPELGDFINKNFYTVYGEGFESPLPAAKFTQDIYDKPYMWVNITNKGGKESKKGTSRIRNCEATYIVEKLREYIQSDAGKDLSYGVITFYSAQVSRIKELMKGQEIFNRVRVGSVDAFQGMEFDVIFLSVVRTHEKVPVVNREILGMDVSEMDEESEVYKKWAAYKEAIGMKNYGFLTSENRLCVALSRQKKLLIVVGDASIFNSADWSLIAEKCVPAMKNFYDLCKAKGAVINV